MKTAFAIWDERIAPVFDVARQVQLIETNTGGIVAQTRQMLGGQMPLQKALFLAAMGVESLVCGAISRQLHAMVADQGIVVIPFIAGAVDEVVQAWLTGSIGDARFAMPGCLPKKRRVTHRAKKSREGGVMPGGMRKGNGQGGGQGAAGGRAGGRPGRAGGGAMAGPEGVCVCPKCSQEEKHLRGTPCMQQQCPKCGTAMVRK